MKDRFSIIAISALATAFSIGIAIVERGWTMDSFWPLIAGGVAVLVIVGVGLFKKWRLRRKQINKYK